MSDGSGPPTPQAAAQPSPVRPDPGRRRIAATARRLAASAGVRFAAAAIGSAILLAATYAGFVLTESGQRLENLALLAAELRRPAVREESLGYLSQLSIVTFALATLGILGIAAIQRRPGLGVLVAAIMGSSTVVAEILKDVLPRPELVSGPAWILRNDFPSGTATVAASLGIGALLVAPERLRWFVLPVGAALAAVIGQATQITGWHRMSSAAGGVLLVIAVASAGLFVLDRWGLVQRSPLGRIHPRFRTALLVVPGAAFLIAAGVLALLLAFPLLQAPTNADSVFLHTVFELLGFGFTILAFIVFAGVIEPFSFGRSGPAGGPAATGIPTALPRSPAAED